MYQPIFPLCVPPLHPSNDLQWVHPENPLSLVIDESLTEDEQSFGELKEVLQTAMTSTLSQSQSLMISKQLASNPHALNAITLSPDNLPALVEHNPSLASDILVRTVQRTPPSVADGDDGNSTMRLLNSLLSIDMSLHSMEVVNHLSTNCSEPGGLPVEFLRTYITSCMSYCENVKDKYLQNRLVRLLCVFIQSLIRNKILGASEEILSQVHSFCVEFSKIREANGLFKLLKSLENFQAPLPG